MKNKIYGWLAFLLIIASITVGATDLAWTLDNNITIDIKTKEIISSSNWKLKYQSELGNLGQGIIEFNGLYQNKSPQVIINLQQAVMKFYLGKLELNSGYGYTAWGTADGVNPTDVINPIKLGTSLNSWEKEPVFSTRATYYGQNLTMTGVLVHDFVPVNLQALAEVVPEFAVLSLKKPESKLKDQELALQMETTVAGFDLKASYFNGYDDWPEIAYTFLVNPVNGQPVSGSEGFVGRYRKQQQFGLAGAGTIGSSGVWIEGAYVLPSVEPFSSDNPLRQFLNISPDKAYLQIVAGTDYTFFRKLYSSIQYLYLGNGSFMFPYREPQQELKPIHGLLTRFSYSLSAEVSAEANVLFDLRHGSALYMPELIYKPFENGSLKIGLILPKGEKGELSKSSTQLRLGILGTF